MSTTFVTRLDAAAGRRLYDAIGREDFQFRSVPHAAWSAKGQEVNVTLYKSGKLVVQGKGLEVFTGRFLADAKPTAGSGKDEGGAIPLRGPTAGSDESGKGDYFGPLVVAAAFVRPEDLELLGELGVRDSKQATDDRVRKVEGTLQERLVHAVRVLEPQAYNVAYAKTGNLNVLLGRLHAEVLDDVLGQVGEGSFFLVVDRFGNPKLVLDHLSPEAKRHGFTMPVRGESHPAVAAASFLARAAFLRSFDELRNDAGGELYLGASDPRIVPLARRLKQEGWLDRFAKLHFKTTQRL